MKNYIIVLIFFMALSCKKKINKEVTFKLPNYFNKKIKRGFSKDSLLFYLKELSKVPKTNLSDSIKAEFHYVTGRYNIRLQRYDEAISDFNEATLFSEKSITSNREVIYFRALMETYFRYKNDYLNGEGTNEKLHSLLSVDDYRNRAYVYNYRQRVKESLNQFEEALIANDSAAILFLKSKDTVNYVKTKISESSIYMSLGKREFAIKKLTEAIKYENHLSFIGKYELYSTLGFLHYKKDQFESSINSYNKSLFFSKQLSTSLIKTRVINNYINLSNVYIELKNFEVAKKYVDSIFILGIKNIDYVNQKSALKTNLEIVYNSKEGIGAVMNQLDSIFSYQEESYDNKINIELKALKKSFKNEMISEKARKKAEIQSLKLERNQYVLAVLLLIALIIGVLVLNFYRQRKFKIEQHNFLLHQRLLRSQMNPHFTFNSLSLIKNEIEHNKEQSIRYIQKFSRLLRAIFINSTKDFVPIKDELQSLTDYIDLQQFRFPDRFDYTLINEIGMKDEVFIPPMLLQPFVENAIIHGFGKNEVKGKLMIYLKLKKEYIECEIDDNGIGVDENNQSKRSSVKLIDKFLKKMTGKGIVMINKNNLKREMRGTRIELRIPYKLF
ncbi:histidine kinase [Tenacibaculum sp.]|nr:histidine kinase [Tenacibaculum sp.]